jgi:hypothetical protein
VLSAVAPGVTADPFGNPVRPVLELQGAAGVLSITDPAVIEFFGGGGITGTIRSESAAQTLQINGPQGVSLTGGNVFLAAGNFIAAGQDTQGSGALGWHSIAAPDFLNGWSGTFKWRPGAENEIKFQCSLTPGTDTNGTAICNLFGIAPAAAQSHAVRANALRTGTVGAATDSPALQLDTSGNVNCFGIAAAATSVVGVGFWPMDN